MLAAFPFSHKLLRGNTQSLSVAVPFRPTPLTFTVAGFLWLVGQVASAFK